MSYFCQPIEAAAHTLLTNENARILKHTIYWPSLLIFHGSITGQNDEFAQLFDKVCDDKMFLESLVSNSSVLLSPAGKHALEVLGDRGRLLLTRCQ